MSTWLALVLPALPLQLAQRALDAALARTLALAIVDGPTQRSRVAHCNDRARAAGIVPGMALAAAQALARELIAIEHTPERQHEALQELAGWAYQFSSRVRVFEDASGSGLLLETGASERLFGGAAALHRRITGGLRGLGYHGVDAVAATPGAARVLAAARATDPAGSGTRQPAVAAAGLRAALAPLPLATLGWPEATLTTLRALGVATIGQVLALPRDAFARRFGAHCLLDLDRLLGTVPDPQPLFTPPERFCARLDLPADFVEVAQLQVPLQRLLRLLEGFLRGHGAGALALLLRAHHNRRRDRPAPPTTVPLALAAPERDARRLQRLFEERLARVALPEPAVTLELQLERMARFAPQSDSFLPPVPQAAGPGTDLLQLAELLHARLGSEGVFQLQAAGDHRPERAYRVLPLSPDPPTAPAPLPPAAQRPAWILAAPRALPAPPAPGELPRCGGPLAVLAGPERIEAGWWDLGCAAHAAVHRDYFVARNGRGQTLWIYRELLAPHGWYLHGYFG